MTFHSLELDMQNPYHPHDKKAYRCWILLFSTRGFHHCAGFSFFFLSSSFFFNNSFSVTKMSCNEHVMDQKFSFYNFTYLRTLVENCVCLLPSLILFSLKYFSVSSKTPARVNCIISFTRCRELLNFLFFIFLIFFK